MKAAELAQNKVLRLLDGINIRDRRSIKDMLEKFDLLSINQTSAQIKQQEAWKAYRDEDYPINLKNKMITEDGGENLRADRTITRRTLREGGGRTKQAEECFNWDAGKMWNQAPKKIKDAQS